MQVSAINNNLNFGHSFRVSICLKDLNGVTQYISPSQNYKLYRTLNSNIVNWLNEDYYANLRSIYGISRKIGKTTPKTVKHREMVTELRQIDDDYAKFNVTRSVYRRNKLGYIATGADLSIIENIKGMKQIGIAKADSVWNSADVHNNYIKTLCKAVRCNIFDYVEHDNILLRSPRNKEIMLKAIFRPAGKSKSGTQLYELDGYEFHENVTKRTLAPVNPNFLHFKNSSEVLKEIRKTVQYHLKSMFKKRVYFDNLNRILYPKFE